MKILRTTIVLFWVFLVTGTVFSAQPEIGLKKLMLSAENNFKQIYAARKAALALNQPTTIYLPEGIMIDVLGIEDGKPVYGVMTNLAHPAEGGYTAFYEQIAGQFDLSNARIHYGAKNVIRPQVGFPAKRGVAQGDSLLLIPDWTNDRVMAFDYATGDLVDTAFVPSSSAYLSSPKEALLSPWGTITVSDQIEDVVQEFDTSGGYIKIFAPVGGPNPAIMDNIRGHAYRPNGNLLVTIYQGTNANAVGEFDQSGNYLGNFIAAGSGGLSSPFSIWFRANDVLVSSSGSNAILQYDLNGSYLNNFASVSNFPEQVVGLPDSNIAVANLTGTSGVLIYSPTGQFIRLLSGVTSNRGVWQLGNGDILTTNSAGIHELDPISGALIRTIISGVSPQFISLYSPSTNVVLAPPENLTAMAGDGYVDLWWHAPDTSTTDTAAIAYHDGSFESQIGCTMVGACELAVRFTPPTYPVQLIGFEFSQQNGATSQIDMKVYLDPAGSASGPTPPAVMAYPGLGGSDGFYDLDISNDNIVITSGDFYLGALEANGFMGIALDTTNQNNHLDRNWASADSGATFDSLVVAVAGNPELYGNIHITAIVLTPTGIAKVRGNVSEYVSANEIIVDPIIPNLNFRKSDEERILHCISNGGSDEERVVAATAYKDVDRLFGHLDRSEKTIEGLDGYNIYRSQDGISFTNIDFIDSLYYRDMNVVNGTDYWYYVTAIYTEGESSPSDTVMATPMAAVADVILTAKIEGDSQYRSFWVNGSWDANGDWDPNWTGPLVELNDNGVSPDAVAGDTYFTGSVVLSIDPMNTYNWWTGSEDDANSFLENGAGFDVLSTATVYSDTLLVDGDGGINEWVIALAGDHNGWNNADDMIRNGTVWEKTVQLTAGTHEYKYAVMHQWNAAYGDGGIGGAGVNFSYNAAQTGNYLFEFDDSDNSQSVSFLVGIEAGTANIPDHFDISANYPNPFNPTTTLKYQVAQTSEVIINVYNNLGQIVRTLVNKKQEPGYYQITWNGKNDHGHSVSSGVYIYQIHAGDFVKSRKMILLK